MPNPDFTQLKLSKNILAALSDLGYENPTPIQENSIPVILEGRDILAQAQTGTGKTASFALPILSNLKFRTTAPQALIIAPTRELAIQVAEAFQSYAKYIKGFNVAPIYGGQDYQVQIRALKRGAQVVVGTPGRVMDHMRRGTLKVDELKTLVLDEADEMLKMGFIDDVEWILSQIPHEHQTALFSATLPPSIKKISERYLNNPEKIHIEPKESTVKTIKQQYIPVTKNTKLDALTRLLEVEDTNGVIIFTRTKTASAELAEKLQARGHAAAALNGDMQQTHRKKVIERTKRGDLDIIIATDVAARGIDIERISHVINFDIPYDTESYIHRIGRTGRAGREGTALLFVAPREYRLLNDIERAVKCKIEERMPPSLKQMRQKRSEQIAQDVIHLIENTNKLKHYYDMVDHISDQGEFSHKEIAAALVYLSQQANPLPTTELEHSKPERDAKPKPKKGKFNRSKPGRFNKKSASKDKKPFNKDKKFGNSKDKKRSFSKKKPSSKY